MVMAIFLFCATLLRSGLECYIWNIQRKFSYNISHHRKAPFFTLKYPESRKTRNTFDRGDNFKKIYITVVLDMRSCYSFIINITKNVMSGLETRTAAEKEPWYILAIDPKTSFTLYSRWSSCVLLTHTIGSGKTADICFE